MSPETAQKLLDINQTFYDQFATSWHTSRLLPWVGFARLASYVKPCERFLDVGCGNGRLGVYLAEHAVARTYVGVDGSAGLIDAAQGQVAGEYYHRNLADDAALADLGQFDAAACLAVLHHIPGEANRVQLLNAISAQLLPGAHLIVSNFRFKANPRMMKKIVGWETVGLDSAELEPNDYLLNWDRGGIGYRYLSLIDEAAMARHIAQTDLQLVDTFHSDGREGNLNLYAVLKKMTNEE